MVLPVDGASGERWKPAVREPRHLGEAALDAQVPAGGPARDPGAWWNHTDTGRMRAQDQRVRDPRLHFRERTSARVVDAAQSAPAIRKVAVQINAVRVPARFVCTSVGIQHRHDPEARARRAGCAGGTARRRSLRARCRGCSPQRGQGCRPDRRLRTPRSAGPAPSGRAARGAPARTPGRPRSARQREQLCGAGGAGSRRERHVGLRSRQRRCPQPPLCRTRRHVSRVVAVPGLVSCVVHGRRRQSIHGAIMCPLVEGRARRAVRGSLCLSW